MQVNACKGDLGRLKFNVAIIHNLVRKKKFHEFQISNVQNQICVKKGQEGMTIVYLKWLILDK